MDKNNWTAEIERRRKQRKEKSSFWIRMNVSEVKMWKKNFLFFAFNKSEALCVVSMLIVIPQNLPANSTASDHDDVRHHHLPIFVSYAH